ncbi:MAG: helix-turn-helix domain-containing protein [Armatimonadota bacterium]
MEDVLKQIAERIAGLRDIAGISAEALAEQLNISVDTYMKYESGTVDIPVSVLYQIAGRFGVELTSILTGENPRLHTYSLVRRGKGVSVERHQAYQYQHLANNFINKKAEPFLVTVEPKPAGTSLELNAHPGQEFNYILSGEVRIHIDGHDLTLSEGDAIYFNASVKHGMKALNGKPAQFLAIIF